MKPLKAALWGLAGVILLMLFGCGVYPVMTEENGRRPHAMGKIDQVFYPYAPQPIHLNEEFGLSYHQTLNQQIAIPQASGNLESVEGLSGVPAQYSGFRYQEIFKDPPYAASSEENVLGEGGN